MAPDLRKLKDRANEAVEKGKHKKAAELFLELAEAEPDEPGWSHRAGELLRRLGRNDDAVAALLKAAIGYAKQGFLLKGVAVLKVVLSVDAGHAEAQRLLSLLLARLAKPQAPAAAGRPEPVSASRPAAEVAPAPRRASAPPAPPAARPVAAPPEPELELPPLPAPSRLATAAITLRPDEPLAALELGRLMPGAHHSREMPALPVLEIPLDVDGIEIGYMPSAPEPTPEPAPEPAAEAAPKAAPEPVPVAAPEPMRAAALEPVPAAAPEPVPEPAAPVDSAAFELDLAEGAPGLALEPTGHAPRRAPPAPPRQQPAPARPQLERPQPEPPRPTPPRSDPPHAAPPRPAPPRPAPPRPAPPRPQRAPHREPTPVEEFAASPSSIEAALGAAEPLVELEQLVSAAPELPPIPLFSSLSPAELRLLVQRVTVLEVADGELVYSEGDPGDALYVVARGAVRVSRGAGRDRVDLERLTEGAFFGEVSLISQSPRPATVVADGDGTLLRVSREVIGEVLQRYPDVLRVLLEFFRSHLVGVLMASSPLFAPFAAEERQQLVRLFRFVEIEAGATVIRQGERTPGLFILLAGRMDVSYGRGEGEVRLAMLGAADLFGEMSLLTHGPAMATIVAATKCWALFVGREQFHEVVLTHPQVLAFISDLAEQRRLENDATLSGARPYGEGRLPAY